MNTRKRQVAMRVAGALTQEPSVVPSVAPSAASSVQEGGHQPANPACVIVAGQRCEHTLVDARLNRALSDYEEVVSGRFTAIVDTLKALSAEQHELDFVPRAQSLARQRLGYELPEALLGEAWVSGLNLRALHSYCIFRSFKECINQVDADQAAWRESMTLDAEFARSCGYHTLDISPCADGRLQGLLPYVFRMAPAASIMVKAYAGAMFNVEIDIADWTQRELERLSGGMPDCPEGKYLKIAVYHYSTSKPCEQGCAAHGSLDNKATDSALARLNELRSAIENTFGMGAAPDILLIGMDTDVDAIRVHLPDGNGEISPHRFVETASLYRDTLGLNAQAARAYIDEQVTIAEQADGWARGNGLIDPGMRSLILRLLEANLSQIEYVIQHHAGRYAIIGHNERFICAGESMSELQLRNKFYFAHLDTVEEGAACMDVGIKIFTGLNVNHGLPVPVLVHFHYNARVSGSRERTIARCKRVKAAIESRYSQLHKQGLLHCQMAISDHMGSERCQFIEDNVPAAGH